MFLFLYILVLGMWSKVLGTCGLERLKSFVYFLVHQKWAHVYVLKG